MTIWISIKDIVELTLLAVIAVGVFALWVWLLIVNFRRERNARAEIDQRQAQIRMQNEQRKVGK